MMEARVLIVEDDATIQRLLRSQLETRGYTVKVVSTGEDAVLAAADWRPGVILLDIALPGMDGLEVCERVRAWSDVPIILLTATDAPRTKITALEMGADDYLTKPFHVGELVARIRAVLRRVQSLEPAPSPREVCVYDLVVDLMRREVRRNGELVHLTRIEFDLLREFLLHPDMVLTYTHLLAAAWGPGYDDTRLVHVHLSNLRRKIEPGPNTSRIIQAVPGIGYRLRTPAEKEPGPPDRQS